MTFSDTAMMELGITQSTNIHNTRSLIRTLKYVLDILQTEEAFTVKEYKHIHTHESIKYQISKLQLSVNYSEKCCSYSQKTYLNIKIHHMSK